MAGEASVAVESSESDKDPTPQEPIEERAEDPIPQEPVEERAEDPTPPDSPTEELDTSAPSPPLPEMEDDVFTFHEKETTRRPVMLRTGRSSPAPGPTTLGSVIGQLNILEASVSKLAREQEKLRRQEESRTRMISQCIDMMRTQSSMLETLLSRISSSNTNTNAAEPTNSTESVFEELNVPADICPGRGRGQDYL